APARLFFYSNFIMALLAGMLLGHHGSRTQRGWTSAFLLASFLVVLMATLALQRTAIPVERGLWVPALVLLAIGIATYLRAFEHISQAAWRHTALGLLALEILLVWAPHIHTA